VSLPLSHQPITCQPVTISNLSLSTYHINMSLINMSNLSLSLILNQILSHGSYTKDTSQLDVLNHQHVPLPSMYQEHKHTITGYVSQPCTKSCTKPSTYTIPNINNVPQPIPNRASTMHQHLCQTVHQPCTITCTICINHQPCT
jgi:hypothetical protein